MYRPEQVAEANSFSPSAAKPRQVYEDWLARGFPLEVLIPEPVTVDQLVQVHDRQFVEDILACKRKNGFENTSQSVAESLPYTVGAMVAGALEALHSGDPVAALVSGFHHACYAKAEGYCTFNGLMVAAVECRKAGAERIGILDLDMHYGNGTDNIIDKLQIDWIEHYTAGKFFCRPEHAELFFEALPWAMDKFQNCDVLLIQLGADPFIDDPFGGFLTTQELANRDRFVFNECRSRGLPCVWNLAGGYARDAEGTIKPVLDIHANSAKACLDIYFPS